MTHLEIREKFINFFKERGHTVVPSSSLLPDDPSVLFTTAGMQQFKPYYTGEADPMKDFSSLNTVSIQKSMRTSDIDEVGDETHDTFFEMLGNFSFGGYWKEEAIKYAYEFIAKEMELPISYVTIFKGSDVVPKDEESKKIWESLGVTDIREEGMEDVFWGPTGNSGPCGPTTEVYCKSANGQDVEIWNIVFNEFYCDSSRDELLKDNAKLEPLSQKGIDTGMGLERLAIAVEKKSDLFETSLFWPILVEIRGKKLYDFEQNRKSERIIADHFRSAIFLIGDGVRPSNVGQGYILRRLLRRAIRHSQLLNLPPDVHERILDVMVKYIYGDIYPELKTKRNDILNTIWAEWQKFDKALKNGLSVFGNVIDKLLESGEGVISAKDAFDLHTVYGFPIELIEELAEEKDLTVDVVGFQKQIEEHKTKSRAGLEKKFGGHGLLLDTGELKAANEEELKIVTRLHTATHMLHSALRKVLGEEVHQAGSDITAERLRFDFTFPRKLTPEEIKQVGDLVNEAIKEDLAVTKEEMPYEDAVKTGALSFFKLKYPPRVNVYSVGDFSKELCGGPHVTHSGEIGNFKITKEEASSAGVRRIRATVS